MSHTYQFDLSHFAVECRYPTKDAQMKAAVDSSFCIVVSGDVIRRTKWVLPAIVGRNGDRVTNTNAEGTDARRANTTAGDGDGDDVCLTAEILEEPQLVESAGGGSPSSMYVTRFTWSAAFNVITVKKQVRINAHSTAESDPFGDDANASPILGYGSGGGSSATFQNDGGSPSMMLSPQASSGHYRQLSCDNANGDSTVASPNSKGVLGLSLKQVSLGRQSVVVGGGVSSGHSPTSISGTSLRILVMERQGYNGSIREVTRRFEYGAVASQGDILHTSPQVVDLSSRANCVYGGQWYNMELRPSRRSTPNSAKSTATTTPQQQAATVASPTTTPTEADSTEEAADLAVCESSSGVGLAAEDLANISTVVDGSGETLPTMAVTFLVNATLMDGSIETGLHSPARKRLETSRFKQFDPFPFVFVIDEVVVTNTRDDAYNVGVKLHKALDAYTISATRDALFISSAQDGKQRSIEEKTALELHTAFEAYVAGLPRGAREHFQATVPFQTTGMRGGGSGSSKAHLLQLHKMFARCDTDEKGNALSLSFTDPASRIVIAGVNCTTDVVAVGDLFSTDAKEDFGELPSDECPSPTDPLERADEIREQLLANSAATDSPVAPGRDPITEVLLRRIVKVNLRADAGDSLNRVLPKSSRQATLDVLLGTPFQPSYYEHNNGTDTAKVASIDLIPYTHIDALPEDGIKVSVVIGTPKKSIIRGQTFTIGGEVVSFRLRRYILPDIAAKLIHRKGPIEEGKESSSDVSKRVLGANKVLTLGSLFDC